MGDILIQNTLSRGITAISNQFIDQYMARANGEFVKVYLYLLRITQGEHSMELASIADFFDCTERDIVRALRYWEKAGLARLTFENRKLTGVILCTPQASVEATSDAEDPRPDASPSEEQPARKSLSPAARSELQKQEDVRQFLYIAEQYLGRTLSRTDIDNLLYYYSELHFNAELIEYLVEYCVTRGHRSSHYIDAVALAWASEGISSAEEAKKAAQLHNKNYFTILKALGIRERSPVEMEQKMMDRWLGEMGFSLDIITEACQRTVMQTGQASFPYTDSILKGWHQQGVRHLSDLEALDKAHRKKSSRPASQRKQNTRKATEYPHRDYDYEEIAKTLFNQ